MKQSNKGSKWWVALSVSFYFAAAPVPGGEAKLNFNGAHFFNVNVTQVTNNITVQTFHRCILALHRPNRSLK